MARYVGGDQVWEIERVDHTLVIRENGKKPTVRRFTGVEAADKMLAKLVGEHVAVGYVLADAPPPEPPLEVVEVGPAAVRSLELERAIAADPSDPAPYLVYADWLQSKGDPRGALIVMMHDGVDIADYAKQHKAALLPLERRTMPRLDEPPFIWRLGFIQRVELDHDAVKYGKDITPTLHAVLTHPSGAVVSEISLRCDETADLRAALAALVHVAPPLRVLEIATRDELGDLAVVLRAFPHLARLSIKHRTRRQRAAGGLGSAALQSIATHVPATIERLEIRVGRGSTFGDLAPLFRRELPRLTHLRVRDSDFADQIIDAVVDAPFAPQLTVLDLGLSVISEGAAQRLADRRERFTLTELWTSSTDLEPPARALVESIAKHRVEISREPIDAAYDAAMKARYTRGGE